jgi:hypothetical protein
LFVLPYGVAVGVGRSRPVPPSPLAQSVRLSPGFALLVSVLRDPLELASPAVGVGSVVRDKPAPFAKMRRVNGSSRYNVPFCVIPERGKVSENGDESARSENADVFHERDSRSKIAHNSGVFLP